VGAAITAILREQVLEFVQQPEAPNLYWALTILPRPLIDVRKGVEAEMNALATTFPEIRDLDASRTPDQWRQILNRFGQKMVAISGDKELQEQGADSIIAQSVKEYPTAKQALLERGFELDRVEAMPAAQVVFVYTIRCFEEQSDDVFKWFFVPYPDGAEALAAERAELDNEATALDPPARLAKLLLPAVVAVRTAYARTEMDIAALRVIEALRIYADSHHGQLPRALADITEVPIPTNPMSGQPFEYRLEGEMAVLTVTPTPGRANVYEIKMAQP
jgi:hypothetical protein